MKPNSPCPCGSGKKQKRCCATRTMLGEPCFRFFSKIFFQVKDTNANPPQVDYATHKPTPNELNNICFLSMKYLAGWNMRTCDFVVIQHIAPSPKNVNDMDGYLTTLAEYIWDHLMGEPADLSTDEILEGCKVVRDLLFTMDTDVREAIEST